MDTHLENSIYEHPREGLHAVAGAPCAPDWGRQQAMLPCNLDRKWLLKCSNGSCTSMSSSSSVLTSRTAELTHHGPTPAAEDLDTYGQNWVLPTPSREYSSATSTLFTSFRLASSSLTRKAIVPLERISAVAAPLSQFDSTDNCGGMDANNITSNSPFDVDSLWSQSSSRAPEPPSANLPGMAFNPIPNPPQEANASFAAEALNATVENASWHQLNYFQASSFGSSSRTELPPSHAQQSDIFDIASLDSSDSKASPAEDVNTSSPKVASLPVSTASTTRVSHATPWKQEHRNGMRVMERELHAPPVVNRAQLYELQLTYRLLESHQPFLTLNSHASAELVDIILSFGLSQRFNGTETKLEHNTSLRFWAPNSRIFTEWRQLFSLEPYYAHITPTEITAALLQERIAEENPYSASTALGKRKAAEIEEEGYNDCESAVKRRSINGRNWFDERCAIAHAPPYRSWYTSICSSQNSGPSSNLAIPSKRNRTATARKGAINSKGAMVNTVSSSRPRSHRSPRVQTQPPNPNLNVVSVLPQEAVINLQVTVLTGAKHSD